MSASLLSNSRVFSSCQRDTAYSSAHEATLLYTASDSSHPAFRFGFVHSCHFTEMEPWCKVASQLKRAFWLPKGPEFYTQHPCQTAHKHLWLQPWGIQCPLMASEGTCTYVHKPTHRHIQTCTKNLIHPSLTLTEVVVESKLKRKRCRRILKGQMSKLP